MVFTKERIAKTDLAHANLWIGELGDRQTLIDQLGVSKFDTVWLDAKLDGGIAVVRQFVNSVLLSPQHGDSRVGIIDGVEHLSVEAQNALLKLLEEPASSLILILLSQTESRILPTVKSRCRIVRFSSDVTNVEPTQSVDQLTQFLSAEADAKRDDVTDMIAVQLNERYTAWCRAGRPSSGVAPVEKNWQLLHNLETQVNKRLLLEQFALESTNL